MNADQLDWLTERVLGAVFEVNTSARGRQTLPTQRVPRSRLRLGFHVRPLLCRALWPTLHIAIHDKVVLNSSMGNQPENIEEPTGSGDPFHVEEISTGIRHLWARRGERRNLSRYPVPAFQGRVQAVEGR